jgi:hypothetical protein
LEALFAVGVDPVFGETAHSEQTRFGDVLWSILSSYIPPAVMATYPRFGPLSQQYFKPGGFDGNTVLHAAAESGSLETMRYLLEAGAGVLINTMNAYDQTPIFLAVQAKSFDVVELLLEHGAELNPIGDCCTALHEAVVAQNLTIVQLLVARGSDVNAQDESGRAPLHYAAHEGHLEIIQCLISQGASKDIADFDDDKPLYCIPRHLRHKEDLVTALYTPHSTREEEASQIAMFVEGLDIRAPDDSSENIPFERVRGLGHGGQGFVEEVRHTALTALRFARKRLHLLPGHDEEEAWVTFQNEAQILRRLSEHKHIINCPVTYDTERPRELAMILHPVADQGSLDDFLRRIRRNGRPSAEEVIILRQSFGCLASALAFTHGKTIRHKDVKPQNILIHEGGPILTDFGISLDCSASGITTTNGELGKMTLRYSAPEMRTDGFARGSTYATRPGRNRKTDIFSLACCFLEILATWDPEAVPLNPWAAPGLLQLKLHNTPPVSRYCEISDQILGLLPKNSLSLSIPRVYEALVWMLQPDLNQRCSADELLQILKQDRSLFCVDCHAEIGKGPHPAIIPTVNRG